jgi:hypothetical protein
MPKKPKTATDYTLTVRLRFKNPVDRERLLRNAQAWIRTLNESTVGAKRLLSVASLEGFPLHLSEAFHDS